MPLKLRRVWVSVLASRSGPRRTAPGLFLHGNRRGLRCSSPTCTPHARAPGARRARLSRALWSHLKSHAHFPALFGVARSFFRNLVDSGARESRAFEHAVHTRAHLPFSLAFAPASLPVGSAANGFDCVCFAQTSLLRWSAETLWQVAEQFPAAVVGELQAAWPHASRCNVCRLQHDRRRDDGCMLQHSWTRCSCSHRRIDEAGAGEASWQQQSRGASRLGLDLHGEHRQSAAARCASALSCACMRTMSASEAV